MYGILEQPFSSLGAINTSGLQTGLQRVQLLKPNISAPALPADTLTMEIRAPDIVIPGQETTYWCYMTELPEGFSRHHIVMVRGGPGLGSGPGSPQRAFSVPGSCPWSWLNQGSFDCLNPGHP